MSSDTQFLNGRVGRAHALQSYLHCKTYIRQNLSPDFQKKKEESPETEPHYEESLIQDPVYNDWVGKQTSFLPGVKIIPVGCKKGIFSMHFCVYLSFCGVYLKEYKALSFLNTWIKNPRDQQEYQFNTVLYLGQKSAESNAWNPSIRRFFTY